MTRDEAVSQIHYDYDRFQQWLRENIVRPDLVGPIPDGEQASPLRRRLALILDSVREMYNSLIRSLETGAEADFDEVARRFREEVEISKRNILADINPTGSSTGSGSNLPVILALGVGAVVLYAVYRGK